MNTESYGAWIFGPRPSGRADESSFSWVEFPMPELQDGEFLAKTECLTMTPANRKHWYEGRIVGSASVARIVESKHPDYRVDQYVYSLKGGWSEYVWSGYNPDSDKKALFGQLDYDIVEPLENLPVSTLTHVLGASGMTAYFGLYEVGEPRPGETIVVAGAAGTIGSLLCQLAKLSGLRVIGIAGGDKKCNWLMDDIGIDGVIDYKSEDVGQRMAELCPGGMDIFFDNVGGDILNMALLNMAVGCRVVICGETSQMELEGAKMVKDTPSGLAQQGPSHYFNLVYSQAEMRGLYVLKYAAQFPRVA